MGLQIVQVSFLLILEGLVMRIGRAGKEVSLGRGKAGGTLDVCVPFLTRSLSLNREENGHYHESNLTHLQVVNVMACEWGHSLS